MADPRVDGVARILVDYSVNVQPGEFVRWSGGVALDTAELAHSFVERGFRAMVVCVDTQTLDASFAGREFDESFLADLPPGVDPCGENGEFHSFVYDGPIFRNSLRIARGESVRREERFEYCDIIPLSPDPS